MERDRLRHSLEGLGIHPRDYQVLKLLPLIYVAWAEGQMAPLKRERIHSFAARHFDLSASGVAVLDRWLANPLTHSYVAEALRDMYFLARAPDDMEIDFSELSASFNTLYPPVRLAPASSALLQTLLDSMPEFVRLMLNHRPASLKGRSLVEVFRMADRDPDALLLQHEAWRRRPSRMFNARPNLVFAVFGRARSAGRMTPEEESRLLRRLISHWALHGTLADLETCAVRRARRFARTRRNHGSREALQGSP